MEELEGLCHRHKAILTNETLIMKRKSSYQSTGATSDSFQDIFYLLHAILFIFPTNIVALNINTVFVYWERKNISDLFAFKVC